MTQRAALIQYVVAVLVAEYRASHSAILRSIERWGINRSIATEIVINTESKLDYFTFIELVKNRHPNKHLIVMHDDIFFGEDFFARLLEQIAIIENAGVKWGVLGPAGVTYPYFKIVRNLVDYHGILYPFWRPLPATHLDGHCLVIHEAVDLAFDPDYRGFHHYDTLLCMQAWAQGLPVFVINLPLRHLGQGNVPEWQERSSQLGHLLSKKYGNKALLTSMGPVKLNSSAGVSRDFYKDEVNPVLDRCFAHRKVADATIIIMIDREDEADIREALLAVCAQFTKPERVIVLCRPSFHESLERLATFFGAFVEILIVCPDEETADAPDDILLGCAGKLCEILPDDGIVSVIDSRTVIFPNYVSDFKKFFVYCFDDTRTIAAFDMNYAVADDAKASTGDGISSKLIAARKTETIEDIVPDNFVPLSSLAVPIGIFKSILGEYRYGSVLHDVFVLRLLERGRFFFLRRSGGFIRTSMSELQAKAKDDFKEIAVLSEFFRSTYPFSFLFMKKFQAHHNEIANGGRERLLARKLSQYPKVVGSIFWLNRMVKKVRNIRV
jgi:hypothetical protein